MFYRLFIAIMPSVNAVLFGLVVTAVAEGATSRDFSPVIPPLVIIFVTSILESILRSVNNLLAIQSSQDVFIYVSEQIATKYIQIPLAIRESRDFADKFERVRDYGVSISSVTQNLIQLITSVIGLISVIIATITVSPVVTLVVSIAAIPSAIISLKLARSRRRNWREYTKDRRIAFTIDRKLTDSNSALDIEINDLAKNLISRMVRTRRRSQAQDLIDYRKLFWPSFTSNIFDSIVSFAIFIYVASQVILGKLAIGQLMTVRSLFTQLSGTISSFFENLATIGEELVNATDYMEFMETPARPNGHIKITTTPIIEFRNVSFTYQGSNIKALNNINLTINPGDSLAIVGENGAGKTTLIKLLIGAYEPTEGEILIDDHPFHEIDRNSFIKQIGALFQEYSRYEFATLGENVWFGDVSRPYRKAEIEAALKDVGLEDLPARYAKGLDQIMSKDFDATERTDLSGGQWQRLSIARAFYRAPNLLILDEPTSAVDAKSEYEIFKNIIKNQQGKTTVIISHRFSTVRKAEQIIVLDHGKIIEHGTHADLLKADGHYAEMFNLQAEGYA